MILGDSVDQVSVLLLSEEELFVVGAIAPGLLFGTTTAGTDMAVLVVAFPKSFMLFDFVTLVFFTLAGSFPAADSVILGFGTSSFLIPRAPLLGLELPGLPTRKSSLFCSDPSPLVELSGKTGRLFLAGTRRLLALLLGLLRPA